MDTSEMQDKVLLEYMDTSSFVDDKETVNKYKCLHCEKVAIQLIVANCDHIFCLNCITKIFGKNCPGCEGVEITEVRKDALLQEEILNLKVGCHNKARGCHEVFPVRQIKRHHEAECPVLVLNHPEQGLQEKLNKIEDNMHQIQTAMQEIGQKTDSIASDMENVKNQLLTNADALQTLEKKFTSSTKEMDLVSDQEQCKKLHGSTSVDLDELDGQSTSFIWKINGINRMLTGVKDASLKHSACETSDSFHNKEFGFSFQACVSFEEEDGYISISLLWDTSGEVYWHARKYTLIDQSDHIEKKHVSMIDTPLFSKDPAKDMTDSYFQENRLAPIFLLEGKLATYVRNDSVLIKLCIIPHTLMFRSVASNNGTLLWRIDNYSKKKVEAVTHIREYLISPSFYTCSQGYRVHNKLFLNGISASRGKFTSIYTVFIIGLYDKLLPFPFNGMIKYFLLDQTETTVKHHLCKEVIMPYNKCKKFNRREDFVLQCKAEEATYLKDDALLLKIVVEIF